MRLHLFSVLALVVVTSTATAADKKKEALSKAILKNCKAELAQEPATDSKDADVAWQNLEIKEDKGLKFSSACDKAEDNYEKTLHHDVWVKKEAEEKAAEQAK